MSASVTQKKPESVSSPEEEALKRNTDCVYFLASPLTCRKGAECEYRHSERARLNPNDCFYWLNGNCMNPTCCFRHPPLDALLAKREGASAGSVPLSYPTVHLGVAKQSVLCVFFRKGMCVKGDMCSFLHTPSPASYKNQLPVEAKANKANVEVSAAPKFTSSDLTDTISAEEYVPNDVGYEPVVQNNGVKVSAYTEGDHGSEDNDSGNNGDYILRESSPGFDVIVGNGSSDSEYYRAEDQYRQEISVSEYDTKMAIPDQCFYPYHVCEDEYDLVYGGESPERGYLSERRVYAEEEKIPLSDLRYCLGKERIFNGMIPVGSNDFAPPYEYRDSSRHTPRESRQLRDGKEFNYGRRTERGRDRTELSQGRIRDRSLGRFEENYRGNQERGFRAPWGRRREMEDERNSRFAAPKSRKQEDHHHRHHRRSHNESGDSFAAPLPFSEILKKKREAASGGGTEQGRDTSRTRRGPDDKN